MRTLFLYINGNECDRMVLDEAPHGNIALAAELFRNAVERLKIKNRLLMQANEWRIEIEAESKINNE